MIEQTVDIGTRDGAMETYICAPDRGGPFAPILFLMDAPGIREELRDMARRLATSGYLVVLPNLYYRAGRDTTFGPDVLEAGSAEHTRMRAVRTQMTIPPVMNDIADMLTYLAGREEVRDGPVGCHGYCMSGPYALAAAARYPDRIAAAASFYGTWLVSDAEEESPHLTLAQAKGELYIACAEFDDLAPLDMVADLKDLFDAAGARGELKFIRACITASPSLSAGATTNWPPNAIGSGCWPFTAVISNSRVRPIFTTSRERAYEQAFGDIRQIGIVVRDIEKAMAHWVDVCGIGPWFYVDKLPITTFRYRGRVVDDFHISVALANSGDTQLELIEQRRDCDPACIAISWPPATRGCNIGQAGPRL